jgi:hypothetical protein
VGPKAKSAIQKAGTALPSKKHEPSPAEQTILEKHHDRTNKNPSPPLKVTHDSRNLKVETNHPDPKLGAVLAMDAIGTASLSFFNGPVAKLAALGRFKSLEETELRAEHGEGHRVTRRYRGNARRSNGSTTMTPARRLAKVETIDQQDSASNMFNKCARTFDLGVN